MSTTRQVLTAAEYSRRQRDGENLDGVSALAMSELSEVRKGADGGVIITISTPTADRYRDCVVAEGISLANYVKNPIVLLNHDYSALPIARAEKTYVQNGRLKSEPEFTPEEVYPLGALVGRMVRAGFLNAASIGFKPTKSNWNETRLGYDYLESDLLEYSIVGVPANPECLVEARSMGMDLAPMRAWIERSLQAYAPELALLPRATVEQALKIASGNPVSVTVPAPAETKAACPECDAEMPDDAETCTECGKPMKGLTLEQRVAALETRVSKGPDPAPVALASEQPAPGPQPGITRGDLASVIKASVEAVLKTKN